MKNYAILTDSSADLSAQMVQELDVTVLPLTFIVDGKNYFNYPDNREMSPEEFIAHQKAGAETSTTAVNVGQAAEAMKALLDQGQDVLVLAFSSGLSGTCNNFAVAAKGLAASYPDRKIAVVDTLAASLGQGLLVYYAAKMRLAGKSMEEVRQWVEDNKLNLCHWFTVNDLMYLKKGGRVSAATAIVGTMLQIKPVMHVDDEGHLIKVTTARGRKGSIKALEGKIEELADPDPANQIMFISHTDSLAEVQAMAESIKARYGTKEIVINNIGPVIGAHTGPGCIALFFLGKHR